MYSKTLLDFVKNNLINVDDIKLLNATKINIIPEVIVDYRNNSYGDLKIRVNKNKTLSYKRKKQSSKKNNSFYLFR